MKQNGFLIILLILFLIVISFPSEIQIENPIVNGFVFSSGGVLGVVIIIVFSRKINRKIKNNFLWHTLNTLRILASLLLVVFLIFYAVSIYTSNILFKERLKILEKDGYEYYVSTRRMTALDDLTPLYYKEKSIGYFLKRHEFISGKELESNGIDTTELNHDYEMFYRSKYFKK